MLISELITTLEGIKNTNGDLPCVTNGFDETNYDDIETIEIINDIIFRPEHNKGHSGQHERLFIPDDVDSCMMPSEEKIIKCSKALFIDF